MKRNKYYSVETDHTYTKFEALADARAEYNIKKDNGIPVELFRVDIYGICHTIKKYSKFLHEKLTLKEEL